MRFCFQDCKYLSPTEDEQEAMPRPRPDHRCTLYDERLYHGAFHPQLIRLEQCRVEQI